LTRTTDFAVALVTVEGKQSNSSAYHINIDINISR